MSEFWSRWHVSLSSWFRDYVYIPLGGNKKGEFRRKLNIFIVFMLSGLWHGANWTFVIWGLLHGLLVVLLTGKQTQGKERKNMWLVTMTVVINFVLVTFLWIFFRSENIGAAWNYIRSIFSFTGGSNYIGVSHAEFAFSLLVIGIMLFRERVLPAHLISSDKRFYLYTAMMVIICYFFGVFAENQFIYFQF
jgi:D-alanyl-lipoteichoic acid acyltransferase DltB (MBOAT superfamily)